MLELPPELREFATRVALVPPHEWEAFVAAASRHTMGTPANVAHAVNAFTNQWTRKQRVPNSHVAALVALLDPAKRDRLNAGSFTVKKWVAGQRRAMLEAAAAEARRRWHQRVDGLARAFLARPKDERAAAFDAAAGAMLELQETKLVGAAAARCRHGWQAVQHARDESRRRALVSGGGMLATDMGCALAEAHKTGTLEKLLTEWEAAG